MENNECNANRLDSDVLLPPRKRLLAGMKRQNSDMYSQTPSTSGPCVDNFDFDTRINNLLKNHMSNPNVSNEKLVEASRMAAVEASKAARAAQVVAEEKAAVAAMAMAAAKKALELVATITNDEPVHQETYLKKNKMKKHVAVESLYGEQKRTRNCGTDEELARKLHQVINSSPRISKNGSTSDSKHLKKLTSEKTTINDGAPNHEIHRTFSSNGEDCGNGIPVPEKHRARADMNISKFKKRNGVMFEVRENGEADLVHPEGSNGGIGKKRQKLKQKKLPLSICNVKDLESPKENLRSKNMSSGEDSRNEPLFHVGPSSDSVGERASVWTFQAFKSSQASVKQNKVMQS